MDRESLIELQKIDCACNDCKFFTRNLEKKREYIERYQNKRGPEYGHCSKKNIEVTTWPGMCVPDNQQCFTHRLE
jgi:hypothetical protein